LFAKLVDNFILHGCCFWVSGPRENRDAGGKGIITSTPVGFTYGFTPVTYKTWRSYLTSFCCQILKYKQFAIVCANAAGPSLHILTCILYSSHLYVYKNVLALRYYEKPAYKWAIAMGPTQRKCTTVQSITIFIYLTCALY
jgi:hypothetical protein